MTFGLVKHNNNSLSAITTAGQLAQGKMTLIKEQTASSSSSISFVHGSSDVVLDSTYPIYVFKFINIHSANDEVSFEFNLSEDVGSNYNVSKTTTFFNGEHNENDATARLEYRTGKDLANGTGNQTINFSQGNDNDQSSSGELILFNPSDTTFVTHFMSRSSIVADGDYVRDAFVAGYANLTSAIDAIKFTMSSGNIDSGTIKLYGIKGS